MLALGYSRQDIFTKLSTPAMIAIAFAAQPGTAVHHSVTEGWPIEAHLLANLSEQSAGIVAPAERYKRPGVVKNDPKTSSGFGMFRSIAEFEARRSKAFKKGA